MIINSLQLRSNLQLPHKNKGNSFLICKLFPFVEYPWFIRYGIFPQQLPRELKWIHRLFWRFRSDETLLSQPTLYLRFPAYFIWMETSLWYLCKLPNLHNHNIHLQKLFISSMRNRYPFIHHSTRSPRINIYFHSPKLSYRRTIQTKIFS